MLTDPLEVVAAVAQVLDELGIDYLVGGSLASSKYGIPRATLDADIVADLDVARAEEFIRRLASDFYVDISMAREAAQRRGTFNVFHRESMFKLDVFIMSDDEWSAEEMRRAQAVTIERPGGPFELRFASAEDTLLHKLLWYRLGDETSDRQWGDITGLVKVQGALLDDAYLDKWAGRLQLSDLLARARGR